VVLAVTSNWGSSFTESGTIPNTSGYGVSGWQIELDTANTIANVWNAMIVSHLGNVYTIANTASNAQIAAGGSMSFGSEVISRCPAAAQRTRTEAGQLILLAWPDGLPLAP